jgi:hypothetical protein
MSRPADPRKQQHWLQHVRRWQTSNLSVRDYCERHHLGEASFYAWKRTLHQRGLFAESGTADGPQRLQMKPPLFLPVALAAADAATGLVELVSPDGWTVRVAVGFDAVTLRQLLTLLRERPC